LKSKLSGMLQSLNLLLGVKDVISLVLWEVYVSKLLWKDLKKINLLWVLLMPKDMLLLLRNKSKTPLNNSPKLMKLLIFGLKSNNYGQISKQSSQEEISPNKCLLKLKNSLLLTKIG